MLIRLTLAAIQVRLDGTAKTSPENAANKMNLSQGTARTRQFADHRFKELLSAIDKNAILCLGSNVRAGFVWRTVELEDTVLKQILYNKNFGGICIARVRANTKVWAECKKCRNEK